MDRLNDIVGVVLLVGALVGAGLWLGGYDTTTFTDTSRRWWLVSAGLATGLVILNAITGDWLVAVGFALWAALDFAMVLAPDLPDRLRSRPG